MTKFEKGSLTLEQKDNYRKGSCSTLTLCPVILYALAYSIGTNDSSTLNHDRK